MQKHTQVYLNALGNPDFIACEVCHKQANSTHHIFCRGMGGSTKRKDVVENLMAMCNDCHEKFGDKVQYYDLLLQTHKEYLEFYGVQWNEQRLKEARKF